MRRSGTPRPRAGIALHELTPVHASLEDAFLSLTRDAVEYRSESVLRRGLPMSRATAPARTGRPVASRRSRSPACCTREWIKFRSLRSTYWAVLTTLLAMVLIALRHGRRVRAWATDTGPDGRTVLALGYTFAQVVVGVLGALLITGEYSTGQIRSTLSHRTDPHAGAGGEGAADRRSSASCSASSGSRCPTWRPPRCWAATAADLGDPEVQRVFWGSGLYLAGVGLLGLGIGALLRHTAGAITAVLGVLLLLSTLVQLLMMASDAFLAVYPYLPATAGERIVAPEAGRPPPARRRYWRHGRDSPSSWCYVLLTLLAAGGHAAAQGRLSRVHHREGRPMADPGDVPGSRGGRGTGPVVPQHAAAAVPSRRRHRPGAGAAAHRVVADPEDMPENGEGPGQRTDQGLTARGE